MCDDELRMILDYAIEIRQFVLIKYIIYTKIEKFDRIINYEIRLNDISNNAATTYRANG